MVNVYCIRVYQCQYIGIASVSLYTLGSILLGLCLLGPGPHQSHCRLPRQTGVRLELSRVKANSEKALFKDLLNKRKEIIFSSIKGKN